GRRPARRRTRPRLPAATCAAPSPAGRPARARRGPGPAGYARTRGRSRARSGLRDRDARNRRRTRPPGRWSRRRDRRSPQGGRGRRRSPPAAGPGPQTGPAAPPAPAAAAAPPQAAPARPAARARTSPGLPRPARARGRLEALAAPGEVGIELLDAGASTGGGVERVETVDVAGVDFGRGRERSAAHRAARCRQERAHRELHAPTLQRWPAMWLCHWSPSRERVATMEARLSRCACFAYLGDGSDRQRSTASLSMTDHTRAIFPSAYPYITFS